MRAFHNKEQIKNSETSPSQFGLAGWIFGFMRGLRNENRSVGKQMCLLETLPLGGKRQLMLVSCGCEYFLVGGGMESIETIVQVQNELSSDRTAKTLNRMGL